MGSAGMEAMRILLVEDEVPLANALQRGLVGEGFEVEVVHDGASALTTLERRIFDIVVLDRDLPILHGDFVARSLRDSGSRTRILMLTAASSSEDVVRGLDLGADDYLSKPFDFDVLLARLRALGRRLTDTGGGLTCADLRIDIASHRTWVAGTEIHLRPKEFQVLAELMRAGGATVSPVGLFDAAWGEDDPTGEAVVKTVIHSLRRKIGAHRITTVHGVGYRVAQP
ncbi:response regulator transcription factor [Schaalia sp. 19OD2882]|uniref:response regulator transcription factor n=1 Tax=Schaalia sp. 19OD2882 TaxID=2794089 RepID=UPI001C1EC7A5|nr:response regulator transcription factor [Schaalia sp. 19OD2882]QWW19973.1 response regulator transcription factor [Schaalia sp. 19OD2882]